jgi:16S rRNA (cytidine1402-2'-O)-methyltransferase
VGASTGRIDVVGTPIGNLADLSSRARDTLAQASLVAAEDTRHSGQLLQALGLSRPMISLHEHNERARIEELLARVARGERIAVVSDAGMPTVSDPGYALVAAALAAGCEVGVVPGPSAVLTALALSGLPTDRFVFEGFLPAREAARRERCRALAQEPRTLVLFESPHRIVDTLQDLASACGLQRRAVVARELTKAFETVYRGSLQQLLDISGQDANFARGEITVVVEGAPAAAAADDAEVLRLLDLLRSELPLSRAAAVVGQYFGRRKADVYQLGLANEPGTAVP